MSLLHRSIQIWSRADGWQRGAALSFYALFSIAPLFLLLLSVLGILFERRIIQGELYFTIWNLLGEESASAFRALITQASVIHDGWRVGVVNVVLAAIGASAVMNQLQASMHTIWRSGMQIEEGVIRRNVRQYVRSFFTMGSIGILLVIGLLAIAFAILFGPSVKTLLIGDGFPSFWEWISSLFLVGFSAASFSILYRLLPERRPSWRMIGIATCVSVLFVGVGKLVIQWYASTKSVFSLFGAGSAVVYLLIWCFYLAQAFLWGAAVAQAVEERRVLKGVEEKR